MPLLKAGDIILQEKPFAFVLDKHSVFKYCSTCLIKEHLLSCAKCKTIKYCSKRCQEEDWQCHKLQCKYIQKIIFVDEEIHLTLRIFAKLYETNEGNPIYVNPHIKIPKKHFEKLESCKGEADVSQLAEILEFSKIKNAFENIEDKKFHDLYEIRTKIIRNAITLYDFTYEKIGTALYLSASQFRHKCVPNAVALFNGPNIVISLTQDVDMDTADDFQDKLFICYLDPYKTYNDRQRLLKNMGRECECQLCLRHDEIGESDMSLLSANYGLCKDIPIQDKEIQQLFQQSLITDYLDDMFEKWFSESPFKEPTLEFPTSTNVYYNKKLLEYCQKIQSTNNNYLNRVAYQGLLTVYKGNIREYYSQNSVYMVNFLFRLYQQAIVQEDWKNADKFGVEVETIIESLFPDSYFEGLKITDGLDSFPKYIVEKLEHFNTIVEFNIQFSAMCIDLGKRNRVNT